MFETLSDCFRGKILHNGLTKLFIALLVSIMLVAEAAAHPMRGGHSDYSFFNGFLHPWQGIDHLVTMIAIGIWVSQYSRNHFRWLLVAGTFSGMMAVAFASSYWYGLSFGYRVENGIGIGLMILGLILVMACFSAAVMVPLVAAMAVFHGAAHAAEIAQDLSASWFGVGLISASLMLQYIGFACGRLWQGQAYPKFFLRCLTGISALFMGGIKVFFS